MNSPLSSHKGEGALIVSPEQVFAEMFGISRFAPLSTKMVFHLIREDVAIIQQNIEKHHERIISKLSQIYPLIDGARKRIYHLLVPLRTNMLMVKQFQELFATICSTKMISANALPGKNYHASLPTLGDWRKSGVLRRATGDKEHGETRKLDIDSVAAILIAASVDERVQGFLPASDQNEPYWWCNAQFPPHIEKGQRILEPPIALPIPLAQNLPSGLLLWSSWPTFDPYWRQFDDIGAMRFSDAVLLDGQLQWRIPQKHLLAWDPDLIALDQNIHFAGDWFANARNHQFAETALLRLALRYLFQ